MTDLIAAGQPIHLFHTIVALDAIRASGQMYASTGSLAAAIYCTPLTRQDSGFRPHNLGGHLLEHRPRATPLIIEVVPGEPAPTEGIDYLQMGRIHLGTFLGHSSHLTSAERQQLVAGAGTAINRAAPCSWTWRSPSRPAGRRARTASSIPSPRPSRICRSWATCTSRCCRST